MSKQWDQKEVQRYIDDGAQESLNLDYKAADALGKSDGKKGEITKDVSAMANSAGGIIIYGIKEFDEPDKRHLPEKLSVIDRTQFSKEWLEQIINTIQPRITGVSIYPVGIDTGANHVVYVVDIPQSTTAHQARDFRYYKRFNFESTPMYDYEVRDVMNRVTLPDAEVEFSYIKRPEEGRHRYTLGVMIKNQGIRAVEKYKLQIIFPNYGSEIICHQPSSYNHPYFGHYDVSKNDNGDHVVIFRSKEALFPKDEFDVGNIIKLNYFMTTDLFFRLTEYINRGDERKIRWTLYADDMPPKSGEIPFSTLYDF